MSAAGVSAPPSPRAGRGCFVGEASATVLHSDRCLAGPCAVTPDGATVAGVSVLLSLRSPGPCTQTRCSRRRRKASPLGDLPLFIRCCVSTAADLPTIAKVIGPPNEAGEWLAFRIRPGCACRQFQAWDQDKRIQPPALDQICVREIQARPLAVSGQRLEKSVALSCEVSHQLPLLEEPKWLVGGGGGGSSAA